VNGRRKRALRRLGNGVAAAVMALAATFSPAESVVSSIWSGDSDLLALSVSARGEIRRRAGARLRPREGIGCATDELLGLMAGRAAVDLRWQHIAVQLANAAMLPLRAAS